MTWAKFQRETWFTYAYPGYTVWLVLTRLGDAYLVYYPWKLCRPHLLDDPNAKLIAIFVVFLVAAMELCFFAGPPNKALWEEPSETTFGFKFLVVAHFVLYFGLLFVLPYSWSSALDGGRMTAIIRPLPQTKTPPQVVGSHESKSPHANVAAFLVLLYSFSAITLPYLLPISIFALGPIIFVPVVTVLTLDRNKDISQHRGYCMLLSIFQVRQR